MQVAGDFRGCGPRGECDGISRGDKVGRGQSDSALLFGEAVYLILEGAIVTKRLIKHRFDRNRSAVRATQQAALFKFLQVTSNRRQRNIQSVTKLFNRYSAGLPKFAKDEGIAVRLLAIARGHTFSLSSVHACCGF